MLIQGQQCCCMYLPELTALSYARCLSPSTGHSWPSVPADDDFTEWEANCAEIGHGEANWAPYRRRSLDGFIGMNCSSHYVTASQGTRLAVDVCLPVLRDGSRDLDAVRRLPAVVQQTRYYRSMRLNLPFLPARLFSFYPQLRPFLVARGYAWVGVDVRGTGASFGNRSTAFSQAEIQDGTAVVDWVISQPWSDGQVAAFGISYDSIAAEHLTVSSVATCSSAVGVADAGSRRQRGTPQ